MAVTSPKKSRTAVKLPAHWLPPERFDVVQIPRHLWSAKYWSLSYSHLRALAVAGQNGLTMASKCPLTPLAPDQTAWIREGAHDLALLYHQNWRL